MYYNRLLNAVTTPLVVRSAMIHGGLGKKSMEEIHVLMSKHSMHVPSPLRLLRIANGKRCEFCVKSKCNHVRPGIGVFACWDCVTKSCPVRSVAEDGTVTLTRGSSLTKAWKTSWSRYRHNMMKYSTIFDHSRVGVKKYSKSEYIVFIYIYVYSCILFLTRYVSSSNQITTCGIRLVLIDREMKLLAQL